VKYLSTLVIILLLAILVMGGTACVDLLAACSTKT